MTSSVALVRRDERMLPTAVEGIIVCRSRNRELFCLRAVGALNERHRRHGHPRYGIRNTSSYVTSIEVSLSPGMISAVLRSSQIRPRGLGRHLLRSRLLGALAYPHGVDRYVELIHPLLLARDVRAEVTAVRHQTSRSVTLVLRPNENWRGFRAGQFVGVSVEVNG